MAPEQDAALALRRLARDVAADLTALDAVALEVSAAAARPGPLGDEALAFLAFRLHAWYTGVEAVLERVARVLEGSVPGGPASHQDLVRGMAQPLPGARPAVLSPDRVRPLLSLLSFRHFFRHAYSVRLDEGELRRHASTLGAVRGGVADDLRAICDWMGAEADRLASRETPGH